MFTIDVTNTSLDYKKEEPQHGDILAIPAKYIIRVMTKTGIFNCKVKATTGQLIVTIDRSNCENKKTIIQS